MMRALIVLAALAASPAGAQSFSPGCNNRLMMQGPIITAASPTQQAATGLWLPARNFGEVDLMVTAEGMQGILKYPAPGVAVRIPAGQLVNVYMGSEDQDSLTTQEIIAAQQNLTLACR